MYPQRRQAKLVSRNDNASMCPHLQVIPFPAWLESSPDVISHHPTATRFNDKFKLVYVCTVALSSV